MIFILCDFALGLMNIALFMSSGKFISAFTAGFCFGMGVALMLDKILDGKDD